MDTDGDGTISLSEFEGWWKANGGDLEKCVRSLHQSNCMHQSTMVVVDPTMRVGLIGHFKPRMTGIYLHI